MILPSAPNRVCASPLALAGTTLLALTFAAFAKEDCTVFFVVHVVDEMEATVAFAFAFAAFAL